MNWQQTNREHRYKYTGDNWEDGRNLEGVETSTKTGETDQGVTYLTQCAILAIVCNNNLYF
jgi:hypothetical protein